MDITEMPPKEVMDKSLKVGEDEWREKEQEILCLKRGLKFEV